MNLIQTARKRADREAVRRQGNPGFRTRRHRAGQRQGGRRRQEPRAGLRGRLHRPCRPRHPPELHRPQDLLRRRCRARVPALLADDQLDQGRAPRQGAPRQAVLSARSARQEGPHRRGDQHDRRRGRGREGAASVASGRGLQRAEIQHRKPAWIAGSVLRAAPEDNAPFIVAEAPTRYIRRMLTPRTASCSPITPGCRGAFSAA